MFGGSDPWIKNLIPSDIEIRRNYIYTPASWKNVWTKKNLLETKNVQRLLIEGNVFDGSWVDAPDRLGLHLEELQSGRRLPLVCLARHHLPQQRRAQRRRRFQPGRS